MTAWAPADCSGRTRLLILQSTPFCNIDCEYCYLPARDDRHRMPFDIVESAVRFVFDNSLAAPDFTIVWHSGEPLVLPVGLVPARRLQLFPVPHRQERTFPTPCRPTGCWWTMNGAISFTKTRFVSA